MSRLARTMRHFIQFATVILAIFAPVVLFFVSPEVFWYFLAVEFALLLIVITVLIFGYRR